MTEELVKLLDLFRENGGIFDNMTIGYREESGYYCSVINGHHNAKVFCPTHLLVDINDIGINETGLFIARPEKYADNIGFLERYFAFHFGEKLVNELLEEKQQIDSLSENEKLLLQKVGLPDLPNIIDGINENLEYVKYRILQSYEITFGPLNKMVIMPVVSFLNHDQNGSVFEINNNGITVSGKFNGEVFAFYNMSDVLMFLQRSRFVTDTRFIYSMPMQIIWPNGKTLYINRDVSKSRIIDGKFMWPEVGTKDTVINVSWFPMYFKQGPRYPSRFAASLAHELSIPAEVILHQVFRNNLNTLLPIVFSLQDSENSYIQMVVSGVKRQLELIGGL